MLVGAERAVVRAVLYDSNAQRRAPLRLQCLATAALVVALPVLPCSALCCDVSFF